MAYQWLACVSMAVVFTAGSCQSNTGVNIDTEGCEKEGFCEKIPLIYAEYQGLIDEKMQHINKTWHHNDVIFDQMTPSENRAHNCATVSKMMKPFVYNGENTMLVVQSRFFEQKFSVTSCKTPRLGSSTRRMKYVEGGQCFDSMNLRFTGTCRTRQTTIKLYVFDIEKKEVQRVPVNIDVCCTCALS